LAEVNRRHRKYGRRSCQQRPGIRRGQVALFPQNPLLWIACYKDRLAPSHRARPIGKVMVVGRIVFRRFGKARANLAPPPAATEGRR
jgi:hypothetical protein